MHGWIRSGPGYLHILRFSSELPQHCSQDFLQNCLSTAVNIFENVIVVSFIKLWYVIFRLAGEHRREKGFKHIGFLTICISYLLAAHFICVIDIADSQLGFCFIFCVAPEFLGVGFWIIGYLIFLHDLVMYLNWFLNLQYSIYFFPSLVCIAMPCASFRFS